MEQQRMVQLRYVPRHDDRDRTRRAYVQLQAEVATSQTQKEQNDDGSSDLCACIDAKAG